MRPTGSAAPAGATPAPLAPPAVLARGPEAAQAALAREPGADRTTERNRSAALDAVRAIAALMVLLAHASFIADNGYPGPVGMAVRQMLGAGVLIFFSLSGYLIAGPFLRALVAGAPPPPIRAYLLRRAARIYPAYWLALGAVVILLPPPGGVRAYQWPVHLLLAQSSWPHAGEPTSIFFVAWTLGVEAAFYLFVPLAALVLRALHPRPWRVGTLLGAVVGAGALTAVWAYLAPVELGSDTGLLSLLARIGLQVSLYAFCPGMALALANIAAERNAPLLRRPGLLGHPGAMLPAAAALWAAAYAMERSGERILALNYQVPFVLASGLILAAMATEGRLTRRLSRLLAPVGLISYGIYLWHDTVVQLVWRHSRLGWHGGGAAWAADSVLVLAATLPLAALSWLAVERPAMRAAARWARRRAPVPGWRDGRASRSAEPPPPP